MSSSKLTQFEKVTNKVTNKIVEALEKGLDGKWELPWNKMSSVAVNAVTGRRLVGISQLICSMEMTENNYEANKWLTFKQAVAQGGKIIKGSSATMVFWLRPFIVIEDPKTGQKKLKSPEGNELSEAIENGEVIWSYRFAPYFNVQQVDGLPDEMYEPVNQVESHGLGDGFNPILEADAYINMLEKSSDLVLQHKGNEAFYTPTMDFVNMPEKGKFKSEEGYYSTVFHEIGHWTGHASRIAREGIVNKQAHFGSELYAQEELVAELTAAFKLAEMGISKEPREDHAMYIASWIKVLKNDSKAIFKASQDAARAVRYMNKLVDEAQPELFTKTA